VAVNPKTVTIELPSGTAELPIERVIGWSASPFLIGDKVCLRGHPEPVYEVTGWYYAEEKLSAHADPIKEWWVTLAGGACWKLHQLVLAQPKVIPEGMAGTPGRGRVVKVGRICIEV
jgi:hypothetical protein